MIIEKKYADIAVEYTSFKMQEQGAEISESMMIVFNAQINSILDRKKYSEKESLTELDMFPYQQAVQKFMRQATKNVKEKCWLEPSFKENLDAKKFVLSVFDYAMAMGSQMLGCPEIPVEPFVENISECIEDIIKNNVTTKAKEDDIYDKQRGVNAEELEKRFEPLMSMLNGKEQTPEGLATLYAEYKALTKRQEDHGAIWRFFHRKENSARNELIEKMETCLENQLPGITKKNISPENIKAAEELKNITKDLDKELMQRDTDTSRTFGYEKEAKNSNLTNSTAERFTLEEENLKIDTSLESTTQKSELKVNENVKTVEKAVTADSQKNSPNLF